MNNDETAADWVAYRRPPCTWYDAWALWATIRQVDYDLVNHGAVNDEVKAFWAWYDSRPEGYEFDLHGFHPGITERDEV